MARRYIVSEFASVSWSGGEMQIAAPASLKTFTTRDVALLHVLAAFSEPRTIDGFDENVAPVIAEWIDAAILVDAGTPELAAVNHWDREALALHASSRYSKWRKTPVEMSAPAVAPRRHGKTVPLATPSATGGDLAALLGARRSRRVWAEIPIRFQVFSDLFRMSARNRPAVHAGYVSRPYPSGGSAYSLELYPVVAENAVETLEPGLYRYLPESHALEAVAPLGAECRRILVVAGNTAATTPPPVAIVITSRYARQSEQYGRLAYTLVLKEVGGLFQTLYLAAESLGLAACALGRGTPAGMLAGLCGTTEIEEPVVGEFAIGTAAD